MKLLTLGEALAQAHDDPKKRHVLLGNGFSRACLNDTFAYDALKSRADLSKLSQTGWRAFDALGTSDFEVVMRALSNASKLAQVYEGNGSQLAQLFAEDAEALKTVLIDAIARSHPDHPFEIEADRYASCKVFLANFHHIYTLNYDLLLYWALMRSEIPPLVPCDDGFRKPDDDENAGYVVWEPDSVKSQNVHYLHGGLHLFDSGSQLQKYTWVNTGERLIQQVRDAMARDLLPVFVSEGSSEQKLSRIRHSAYLSRAERSLYSLGNTLFVFGHSMADSDGHILRAIRRSKLTRLFVGIFGDPQLQANQQIVTRTIHLADGRSKTRPLEVQFYDAQSAVVWG
jgi:hypothetical protein